MTEFLGLSLVVVGAYHLAPAFTTDTIPATSKGRPLRKTEKLEAYRITLGVFIVITLIGCGILLAALLKRAGP